MGPAMQSNQRSTSVAAKIYHFLPPIQMKCICKDIHFCRRMIVQNFLGALNSTINKLRGFVREKRSYSGVTLPCQQKGQRGPDLNDHLVVCVSLKASFRENSRGQRVLCLFFCPVEV